ncbi:hypothetical protein JCM8202_002796 [Rhodotorula sphaerocarpa]
MSTAPTGFPAQLLRAALPHVRTHGFTAETLRAAHAPSALTDHTLHALFPSPPTTEATVTPGAFSWKGLAMGNGGKTSLSKHQLVALARAQQGQSSATAPETQPGKRRERTGPARALVQEWLREGRRHMTHEVRHSRLQGDAAFRKGLEARLQYNEEVLDRLPQALALLNAPTSTYLSDLSAALPIPHVTGHLSHVAEIAHDLARASGSQAQGTEWYSLRLRLGTVYALSELSLLAPSSSALPARERIDQAVATSHALLERTGRVGNELDNARMFAEWVAKSWAGIGRSLAP